MKQEIIFKPKLFNKRPEKAEIFDFTWVIPCIFDCTIWVNCTGCRLAYCMLTIKPASLRSVQKPG